MAKSVNKVILLGNVGKDPEIKATASGTVVATFSIATSERFKDKDRQLAGSHRMAQPGCLSAHRRDHSRLREEGQQTLRRRPPADLSPGTTRPPARKNIRRKSSSTIYRFSPDAAKAMVPAAAATANPTLLRSISAVLRRIILNPPKSPTTISRSNWHRPALVAKALCIRGPLHFIPSQSFDPSSCSG